MMPSEEPLELAPARGWLRGGRPWQAAAPFYAVLGDPIAHSRSPALQAAGLRARGLPHAYLAARVPAGRLAALRDADWDPGLAGFNVTAPLKIEAAALCDELTAVAARCGAVNTVRVEGRRWTGHNTDVEGIARVLARRWPDREPPDAAFVLGAGGSARAAVLALLERGAGCVTVRCREPARAEDFRRWLAECRRPGATAVAIEPLAAQERPAAGESAVWIVCLGAGVTIAPAPDAGGGQARAARLVLDLRYGPALPAATCPAPRVDGLPVLLAQGGLAFAWWFGEPVPWAAMGAALGESITY
jgi:shikimate dehydrogenase